MRFRTILLFIAATVVAAVLPASAAEVTPNITTNNVTASTFRATNFSATNLTVTNFKIEGSPETKLLQLAKNRFKDISREEERFFRAVAVGEIADLKNPENKVKGDLKADRIAWICTDIEASALVTPKGIRIRGAHIVSRLDLKWAKLSFQVEITDCVFTAPIDLSFCHLRSLSLRKSQIKELQAEGLRSDDNVLLDEGFKAGGNVNLDGATIGGNLVCNNGSFSISPEGNYALNVRSAKIAGNVFLSGHRSLSGDKSGDQSSSGEQSLSWERASSGKPSLSDDDKKFHSNGTVDLSGATIGGDLECINGLFSKALENSLLADSARIDGSLFLTNGFEADGAVRFTGAKIGHAVRLESIKFNPEAIFDLRFMTASTLLNEVRSWPREGRLYVEGLVYEELDDAVSKLAKIQVEWLHRQQRSSFIAQPYEQLAAVLRHMGREEEAVNVLIAKNDDHGEHPEGVVDWFWYSLVGKLIGYGYRPANALTLSVLVIAIGSIIFATGYRRSILTPRDDRAYVMNGDARQVSDDYPRFNAFIYSLETFVPLVKLEVEQYWIPNANRGAKICVRRFMLPKSGAVLRWYLWFHIIAGWILTTLWVGGLSGLLKT